MLSISDELNAKLASLDAETARMVEQLVRDALQLAEGRSEANNGAKSGWPEHYFEHTSGALANEPFERPPQGTAENRERW